MLSEQSAFTILHTDHYCADDGGNQLIRDRKALALRERELLGYETGLLEPRGSHSQSRGRLQTRLEKVKSLSMNLYPGSYHSSIWLSLSDLRDSSSNILPSSLEDLKDAIRRQQIQIGQSKNDLEINSLKFTAILV